MKFKLKSETLYSSPFFTLTWPGLPQPQGAFCAEEQNRNFIRGVQSKSGLFQIVLGHWRCFGFDLCESFPAWWCRRTPAQRATRFTDTQVAILVNWKAPKKKKRIFSWNSPFFYTFSSAHPSPAEEVGQYWGEPQQIHNQSLLRIDQKKVWLCASLTRPRRWLPRRWRWRCGTASTWRRTRSLLRRSTGSRKRPAVRTSFSRSVRCDPSQLNRITIPPNLLGLSKLKGKEASPFS